MKTVYAPDTTNHILTQVQALASDYPAAVFVVLVMACALFATFATEHL